MDATSGATPPRRRRRTATLAKEARQAQASRVLERDELHGITVRDKRGQLAIEWLVHRDPFMAGLQLHELRGWLDGFEHELVGSLRKAGLSWDEIAGAWGMSRQGVQKRFQAVEDAARAALVEAAGQAKR